MNGKNKPRKGEQENQMEQKNLNHMSVVELKAIAYDVLSRVEVYSAQLKQLNEIIRSKQAEQPKEDAPVVESEEKKEV